MDQDYDEMDDEMGIGSGSVKPSKIAPWVEKYRPERVDDVSHQEEVVKTLKKSIESGNLPHLLFHGPPGTGKTTTVLALARALYGPELYRTRILELNASDERGIKIVRDKIKIFAQGAVGVHKTPGYPCPRFKLIILDEADTMTPEAQAALRRVMETFSKVTRFVLICNYVTRIIEPLASRCAKFRFTPLPPSAMTARILSIAEAEQVTIDAPTVELMLQVANGDMRKAVTLLQSCHQLAIGQSVTPALVLDTSGAVPDAVIEAVWNAIRSNAFDRIQTACQDLTLQGFSMPNVLIALMNQLIYATEGVSDIQRAQGCEVLAKAEANLVDGASEALQMLDVATTIAGFLQTY